jgi:hypothetical protein
MKRHQPSLSIEGRSQHGAARFGLPYYPNYICKGIAIDGNPSVPAYPASQGCSRIPMFAAEEFSQIATIGMVVIIHSRVPLTIA